MTIPDHEHDWRLAYGDTEGRRGYDCAVPGCPAELTAGPPVPLSRERPAPQVGQRGTIGYGQPDYPAASGIVTEVKPSRIHPEVNMVRVAIDPVWVPEEELR